MCPVSYCRDVSEMDVGSLRMRKLSMNVEASYEFEIESQISVTTWSAI